MDGSVKNLLAAEKEAQKIIGNAYADLEKTVENAEATAQSMLNEVRQKLNNELQGQEDEVSQNISRNSLQILIFLIDNYSSPAKLMQ